MTPNRLRALLGQIGWSQRELARRTGYDERQVRRWGAGGSAVPASIAAWLEEVDAVLARRPPPPRPGQEVARAPAIGSIG